MSEGNVQLKLQVGLDLAFLRKQLSGIGTSLAGQPLEINVKFNRQVIANEYRLLNRYLNNKTFRISVETNLKAEIAYADTLQRKLKELSAQRVQNLAGAAATGRAGGFIDEGKFNAYLNRLTKAPLEAVRNALQSSGVQMKAAGKGTVEELRQSILSGLPQVTEDIAKGLTRGLNPKMQESGRKGARSAIDGFKDAAGIASPSKVFKQLGRFSAEGFGIGFFNEFSRFQSRATAQVRQFVGVLSLELARVQVGSIGAGRGMLAGSPRGGGAHMAPIGPLPHGSQEPWAYNQQAFRYEPRLAQPGQARGANVSPMRERFPFAAAPSIMGTTSSPGMLGRGFPALPPAGGTAGTREASLALRELAAHGRSAARAASVFAEDAARAAQRSRLQTVSGQMPMGGGGGFLPPRGGVPRGGAPFNGFPSDGMMGPSTTKGQAAIHTLTGSLKDADQYLRQARVPLAGAIEGLGSEFANATKQVLLYGTAYKALAFFMDLPSQALAAATALQTFRNQLDAVTGSSENASRSFGFIDGLADRFAVPLESVRQGFVRMYASMEPAGFGATEIEGLFTGVSKAAATFGMSKDQVDRVTYALSQMASKGQIMAEEVRGQLGDVLPGSFALFAEAAQMSIPEFTKAMEDGKLSGEAMRTVLNNVGILLNTKFARGAEGAAKTLQGALNTMGTAVQRLYESFEPLVNQVAQRVFPLIAEAMADATSGIKAFVASITGANAASGALNGTASVVAQVLQSFAEIGRAIGVVFASILPTLAGIGRALLFVAEQVAKFINTDFGGWLAGVAVQALLLNAVLIKFAQLLGLNLLPALLAATKSLLIFSARLQAVAVAKGVATAATFAFTGALKLLLIPLLKFAAPVAIVAGIMAIADAFGSASKRARELRAAAIDATQAIRGMSTTEAIQAGRTASSDIQSLRAISGREDVSTREGFVAVSAEEKAALERAGISTTKQVTGGRGASGIVDVVERNRLTAATLSAEGRKAEADFRVKQNRFEDQQASQALRPVELQGADDPAGSGAAGRALGEYESSRLEFLQQRLTIEKQILEARLQQNLISETAFKLAIAELEFETEQATIAEELRLRVLAANKENLSAADKIRKVKDLEEIAERKLLIATEKRAIVLGGIKKELAGPILDANEQSNEQISEQNMLLGRLANGYQDLSLEQKAILEVGKLTNKLSGDQLGELREEIALLEKSTVKRLENARAIERATKLLELKNRMELAGIFDPRQELRRRLEQEGLSGEALDQRLESQLQVEEAERLKERLTGTAQSIGDSFGEAFKGVITGASSIQEALAGAFRSIADSFADMVGQMIAQWMKGQVLGLFQNLLPGPPGGGLGSAASNLAQYAPIPSVIPGFANGGVVTGPTLGLVGEGRYNEAIVPLPDGKSIPVDLGGGASNQINSNITVNVNNGQAQSNAMGSNSSELGRKIEGAVKQVIVGELRPGGLLAR